MIQIVYKRTEVQEKENRTIHCSFSEYVNRWLDQLELPLFRWSQRFFVCMEGCPQALICLTTFVTWTECKRCHMRVPCVISVVWSWWSLWLGHFASRCWLYLWPGKHCLCDVCSFLNRLRFVSDCCKSSTFQIQLQSLLPVFREGYFSTSMSSLLAGSTCCIKLQLNL
jgi:hypothetical protein